MIFIPILLGAAVLVLLVLALHKLRKIHLASYELLAEARATREETMSLFAQLQAADSLNRLLQLNSPLPTMRGWAGSPDFLLHVVQTVRGRKPAAVMECSSGVSTLVVARSLQQNGSGHVWSLEHDPVYAAKTRVLLAQHGLSDWATVLEAPLQGHTDGSRWYGDAVIPADLPPIDLLLVDGPPQSSAPMARAPAFGRLRGRLAPGAQIFVDDASRPDETAMVQAWQTQEPLLTVEQWTAEKGLAVVTLPR
jgi:predicted O-methyltransferase YrrM